MATDVSNARALLEHSLIRVCLQGDFETFRNLAEPSLNGCTFIQVPGRLQLSSQEILDIAKQTLNFDQVYDPISLATLEQVTDCHSTPGFKLLMLACFVGNEQIAKWLVEERKVLWDYGDDRYRGRKSEELYQRNIDALKMACRVGHFAIAQWLYQKINTEKPDNLYLAVVLAEACRNGHLALVQLFLQQNDIPPYNGLLNSCYFHETCRHGYQAVAECLLQQLDSSIHKKRRSMNYPWKGIRKSWFTGVNTQGNTALHETIEGGHEVLASWLVKQMMFYQYRASLKAKNPRGQTALDMAIGRGFDRLIEVLQTAIATTTLGEMTKQVVVLGQHLKNQVLRRQSSHPPAEQPVQATELDEPERRATPDSMNPKTEPKSDKGSPQPVARLKIIPPQDALNRALKDACQEGQLSWVKVLVAYGADVCHHDAYSSYASPILAAFAKGHFTLVRWLVDEAGVSPNTMGTYDLMVAWKEGHFEIVRYLVTWGAGFTQSKQNQKPIALSKLKELFKWACAVGERSLLEMLVSHSIDPDNVSLGYEFNLDYNFHWQKPPIYVGCTTEEFDNDNSLSWWLFHQVGFRDLLETGGHCDEYNPRNRHLTLLLKIAIQRRQLDSVQRLLAAGADIRRVEYDWLALATSCYWSYDTVKIIEWLFAQGKLEHFKSDLPLQIAYHSNNLTLARGFLQRGAPVNQFRNRALFSDTTPLSWACEHDWLDFAEALLDAGADPAVHHDENNNSLYWACHHGWHELVQKLLLKGANPDKITNKGNRVNTPLGAACKKGHLPVVQCLIAYGAPQAFTVKAKGYNEAFSTAQQYGHIEVATWLLAQGLYRERQSYDERAQIAFDTLTALNPQNPELAQRVAQQHQVLAELIGMIQRGELVELPSAVNGVTVNPTLVDEAGNTLLHHACAYGRLQVAQHLVEVHGLSPRQANFNRETSLHLAAAKGWLAVVNWLLTTDLNVNAKDTEDETPIHKACRGGYLAVAKALVAHGANFFVDGYECHSSDFNEKCGDLLIQINDSNRQELIRWLVEREPAVANLLPEEFVRRDGLTAFIREVRAAKRASEKRLREFHRACSAGQLTLAKELINEYPNIDVNRCDDYQFPALEAACRNGYLETAQWLVEMGAKPVELSHLLRFRSFYSYLKVVRWLVDEQNQKLCPLSKEGLILVSSAYAQDDWSFLQWLTETQGACPSYINDKGQNVLHAACEQGCFDLSKAQDTVRWSIETYGFFLHEPDPSGRTALHWACRCAKKKNALALVQWLVEVKGVDIGAVDNQDNSALHHACGHGCLAVARWLIAKGMGVEATNHLGETPLFVACKKRNLRQEPQLITEMIDKHGANPQTTDGKGNTLLHAIVTPIDSTYSRKNEVEAFVKRLLPRMGGASALHKTNQYGQTAYYLVCIQQGRDSLMTLLEDIARKRPKTEAEQQTAAATVNPIHADDEGSHTNISCYTILVNICAEITSIFMAQVVNFNL